MRFFYSFFILATFIVLALCNQATQAQVQEIQPPLGYSTISDLYDEWQVYDNRYQRYVPYLSVLHRNTKSASFWLNADQHQPYKLIFYAYPSSYLFINKKLAKKIDQEGWYILSIDSLVERYKENKFFCTFYDPQYRLPLRQIMVANRQRGYINPDKKEDKAFNLMMQERKLNVLKDFITIVFLTILFTFTFIWVFYRKDFLRFYSLRSGASALMRNNSSLINKPFNLSNLILILFLSQVIAYCYILIQQIFYNLNASNLFFKIENTFLDLTIYYLGLFAVIFTLLLGKYFLNWLFANLLGLEKIINLHYFEYFRLSYLFYVSFGFIATIIYLSFTHWTTTVIPYLAYLVLFFYIFQIIFILFYIYSSINLKRLYLFYYLCITELTPLLIGVKLLM